MRYALGLPPKTGVGGSIMQIQRDFGGFFLRFQRPANRADLTYQIEASSDLSPGSWNATGISLQRLWSVSGMETWEGRSSGAPTVPSFLRLRVGQN